MALNYRPVDRDQLFLVPPDMREWLAADHLAWFILDMVAALDTSALHKVSRLGRTGREGYDPEMLLGLWLYASARGISSSRVIERACSEDVAFRVLCAQDVPDHTVLCRFRQQHEDAMAGLFAQVLVLCLQAGLGRFGVVAIDGTKIKANAAKDKMRTLKRLRVVAETELAKAAATDAAEDAAKEPSAHEDLPPGMGPGSDRVDRIRAAIADSKDLGGASDGVPVRLVQGPGGASRLARAEAAITDLEGVVEAASAPTLKKLLARLRMAEETLARLEAKHAASRVRYDADVAAKRLPGQPPLANNTKIVRARRSVESASARLARARQQAKDQKAGEIARTDRVILQRNLTDPQARLMQTRAGFIVGYNAQITAADDQLILAVEATDHPNDLGQLIPQMDRLKATVEHCQSATERTDLEVGMVVVDNGYLSAENVAAPGFDRLIAPGRGTMKDGEWVGKIKGREGDNITAAAAHMVEKLALPGNQERYKRRSGIVEPPNAWLKDRRGLRQFSRRGLTAVNAELNLAAMTTNLLKLFALTNQRAPTTG